MRCSGGVVWEGDAKVAQLHRGDLSKAAIGWLCRIVVECGCTFT